MKRHWIEILLPAVTLCAVLFAVFFPQFYLEQRDRQELNVLHREMVDEVHAPSDYTVSGADRLDLFRRSGIAALNGKIVYQPSAEGVSVEILPLEYGSKAEKPAEKEEESGLRKPAGHRLLDHLNDYLLSALGFLEEHRILNQEFQLSARYEATAQKMQVEYCTVTDESDPFFSMTLLCVHCALADEQPEGPGTEFSMVLDEENGGVYALSAVGEAELLRIEDPASFAVMANMIGLSCTEYDAFSENEENMAAKFNFSGYSYWLERRLAKDGSVVLEFNPEQTTQRQAAAPKEEPPSQRLQE